jgi:hypothetical protein
MFEKTKRDYPEMLEWLDEPEAMMKSNQDRPDSISYKDFEKYHKQVLATVKLLEH